MYINIYIYLGKHAEKHGRKATGSNPSGMTAGCPIKHCRIGKTNGICGQTQLLFYLSFGENESMQRIYGRVRE
jgi:hypothetical protein